MLSRKTSIFLCSAATTHLSNYPATNMLLLCSLFQQQRRDNICRYLERELGGLYEAMRFLEIKEGVIVTFNQKDKFTANELEAYVIPAYEFLAGVWF